MALALRAARGVRICSPCKCSRGSPAMKPQAPWN